MLVALFLLLLPLSLSLSLYLFPILIRPSSSQPHIYSLSLSHCLLLLTVFVLMTLLLSLPPFKNYLTPLSRMLLSTFPSSSINVLKHYSSGEDINDFSNLVDIKQRAGKLKCPGYPTSLMLSWRDPLIWHSKNAETVNYQQVQNCFLLNN